jgi:hypothetical protein
MPKSSSLIGEAPGTSLRSGMRSGVDRQAPI